MRLYDSPMSSNARRARMAAIELGVKLEVVPVNLPKREQQTPAYLKLNPNGRVPVLEDGDFVLWESHAIMEYLADITPGQTLLPTEPKARADVMRWMFWTSHHWAPAVGVLNWENVVKKFVGGDPDPRDIARGEKLVTDCARVLDQHLEGKKWLAQDRLTFADISVSTPFMALEAAKLPILRGEDHPHIRAWLGRVQDLDAWKKTDM